MLEIAKNQLHEEANYELEAKKLLKFSNLINDKKVIAFDDGKWTFATYASKSGNLEEALYLMRQLNIALNRDINKLKRVIFTFNIFD